MDTVPPPKAGSRLSIAAPSDDGSSRIERDLVDDNSHHSGQFPDIGSPEIAAASSSNDIPLVLRIKSLERLSHFSGPDSTTGSFLSPDEDSGRSSATLRKRQSMPGIMNNAVALGLANPGHQAVEDDQNHRRVQKHPATFQCTLCPKRFTRAYNLRSHLRTHEDERPFICTICGKAFARQHDRKRHEGLHSREKKFICKGDIKAGGSWGCGRQFARVDALGRHLQSETGRVCIKPLVDEEMLERQQGRQKQSLKHMTINDEESPLMVSSKGFNPPASLLAQYPGLAQVNWQAMDTGDINDDSGFDSNPEFDAADYGRDRDNDSKDPANIPKYDLHLYQPISADYKTSRRRNERISKTLIALFVGNLAAKSDARTWGKSAIALLGRYEFVSRLQSFLDNYAEQTAGSKTYHDNSILSVKDVFRQFSEKVSRAFHQEITTGFPNQNRLLSSTQQASTTTSEQKLPKLVNTYKPASVSEVLEFAEELFGFSTEGFQLVSHLIRRLLYENPESSLSDARKALFRTERSEDIGETRHINFVSKSAVLNKNVDRNSYSSSSLTVLFIHNFSLLEFLRSNFPNRRVELSELLSITGTVFYAYATTCSDYIAKTWPRTNGILLPLVQEAVDSFAGPPEMHAFYGEREDELCASWSLALTLDFKERLVLHIKGSQDFKTEITQQMCWLSTAFCPSQSPHENITYCIPAIEDYVGSFPIDANFRIHTRSQELHLDEKKSCWISLFSEAVLAYGFPIPKREHGIGLELSIELMAAIIGARHAVTYDNGVIMKGFSSMFVPVKLVSDGIQWHYVANEDPDMQLSYDEGIRQCPDRLLLSDVDLNHLKTARCFVGWHDEVAIQLGSETSDYNNIDFSNATEVKNSLQISGASLGFQQFGFAQFDVTLGKRDGKCHFQRNSSYRRIVSASERTFVALFDTAERRGWLVKASGVLLHTLRHRMSLGLGGVPVSKAKLEPAQSFAETLLRNAKVRLSSQEEEPIFVDEVVTEIWSIIELLQAQSVSMEKNSKTEIHTTWQHQLFGYEYKAVAEDWSPMPLKSTCILKSCGGWPKLVRDVNALVLLGNGFGEILRPLGNLENLCHQMKSLPREKDYLGVPVKVLLDLYSLAGGRLTKERLTATNLQLHAGGTPLFRACPTPKKPQCSCNRLQQVVCKSSFGRILVPDLFENNGAAMIGESGSLLDHLKIKKAPKITGIFSQSNTRLDSKPFPNGDSEMSIDEPVDSPDDTKSLHVAISTFAVR